MKLVFVVLELTIQRVKNEKIILDRELSDEKLIEIILENIK